MIAKFKEMLIPFLYLVLGIHIYAIYLAWQEFSNPAPALVAASTQSTTNSSSAVLDTPRRPTNNLPDVTSNTSNTVSDLPTVKNDLAIISKKAERAAEQITTSKTVSVPTNLYNATLSYSGAEIISMKLLDYPDADGNPHTLIQRGEEAFLQPQTGIISDGIATPEIQSEYRLTELTLNRGEQGKSYTVFTWDSPNLTVKKTYIFYNNSYAIDYNLEVIRSNNSAEQSTIHPFVQFVSAPREPLFFSSSFIGGVSYGKEQEYKKIKYKAMEKGEYSLTDMNVWFGLVDNYFLTAFIPSALQTNLETRRSKANSGHVILTGTLPGVVLSANESHNWSSRFFLGPKKKSSLEEIDPTLSEAIDYGVLAFLSKPMFLLMEFFHKLVGNWGWAIILLTMVVRLVLYWPAQIAFVSMSKIKKVHPEMLSLRERYAEDRQKLGLEMMKLYKEHKINPLSGCLPILLQIPVFIALFWMLSESVELKYAPWILWIKDLSSPDSFYILPVLMALSMMIQQSLTAQPTDPMQKKVFALLPIIFGGMSIFFPSGLVLYWLVNNVLSVVQQMIIEKKLAAQESRHR